jgi:hypothetical protein
MANTAYPLALRHPAELMGLEAVDLLPLALLSPEQQQHLLEDLQALACLEYEFLVAQRAISQIDLWAATIAGQTLQAAELITLLYGGSPELAAFDQMRRAQYLETMHQLAADAQAQILARLQRRTP